MPLSRDQLRIRVKAAREVAGLSRVELGRLMKADGYGKEDPAALERKVINAKSARELPLTPGRIESLSRHTGFPRAWFLEPDHRKLFGPVSEMRDELVLMLQRLDELDGPAESELEADEERVSRRYESSDRHSEEQEPESPNG